MDPKRLRDLPWLSIVHAMLSDYWLEVPDPPISILANFLDYPHETRTLTYPTALNIFINQAFKLYGLIIGTLIIIPRVWAHIS